MLSKGLKKFKERIFSASRKEESFSGTDYSEGSESPGNNIAAPSSARKFGSIRSKNSSYAERGSPEVVATSTSRSNMSVGHGPQTITLKESPMLSDHSLSPSGGTVLPPVQINCAESSFTTKAPPTPNLASMLNATSGRRKSTPAALDMVLRTAEGKAAVEQLLQPGHNKLVFGNYFAGTSAAARDQAAAVAASEKQRAKAMAGAGMPLAPRPPSSMTIPAHKPSTLPSLQLRPSNDAGMATVPEDVAMDETVPQRAAPSSTRKHPSEVLSSLPQSPAGANTHKLSPTQLASQQTSMVGHSQQQLHVQQQFQQQQQQQHQAPAYQQQVPAYQQQQQHQAPAYQQQQQQQQQQQLLSPPQRRSLSLSQSQQQLLQQPQPMSPQQTPSPPPQQQQASPQSASPPSLPAPSRPSQQQQPNAVEEATAKPASKLVSLSPQLPAAMQRKYWSLADYNIIRKMYTGYASTVYQAMCKKSLEMVALKVYHMQNLCELNHYQVFREIRVHSSLQHQNIIHLFASFQEGTDVVLVQEYAEGGDLYRLLHKNGGRLSERQAVEMVLHPFLLALHYLHTRGIMHRDIKPENVLFTEHRVLKLADFGLAIDLNEERAVTRAGTLDYMAPEVLRCPPKNLPQENKNNPYLHYNNSVDAWAVGVFAYELIVGFPPFAGETQLDSVDRIMHSVPEFPGKISEFAKDFICQCLRKHPGDRPTVMELLHHPWIRTFQRRTSMRITAMPRRRSSVMYNPGSLTHGHLGGGGGVPEGYPAPQEGLLEDGLDAAVPMDTDVSEMTPEQIEQMILRLQVAKAQALSKNDGERGAGDIVMQAVHPLHI